MSNKSPKNREIKDAQVAIRCAGALKAAMLEVAEKAQVGEGEIWRRA